VLILQISVRMEDGKQMEAPVIPKEVEALPPPPPKSPSKTVEPTSPLKHQSELSYEYSHLTSLVRCKDSCLKVINF